MSHYHHSSDHRTADADLLTRVGIALTTRQNFGQRTVQIKVVDGIVTLHGLVSSFHERQLTIELVRRLPGVRRICDEITVVGKGETQETSRHDIPSWNPASHNSERRPETQSENKAPSGSKLQRPGVNASIRKMSVGIRSFFWGAVLMLVTGCGETPSERVTTFPIEGTITFKGQSIPGAFVTLHPKTPLTDVPPPRANILADGSLKVSTFDGGDGAPEGEYILTIEWYKPVKNGSDIVAGPNVIPKMYSSPRTSNLIIHVAAKENKLDPIQL